MRRESAHVQPDLLLRPTFPRHNGLVLAAAKLRHVGRLAGLAGWPVSALDGGFLVRVFSRLRSSEISTLVTTQPTSTM